MKHVEHAYGRANIFSEDKTVLYRYFSAMLELLVLFIGGGKLIPIGSMFKLFMNVLILDRTSSSTLHTVELFTFFRLGGFNAIFDICGMLISHIDELVIVPEDLRTEQQKKCLSHAYSTIKLALYLIHPIISSKPLFESGQTILIVTRDKKDTDPDYFEPHNFLVKLRHSALPTVRRLWESSWLAQAPLDVSKYVARCVLEIANGENEDFKGDPNNSIPAVVPRSTRPSESQIRMLTDMGFPRSAAERALTRTHNDVNSATELLLSRPFRLPLDVAELEPANPPAETEFEEPAVPDDNSEGSIGSVEEDEGTDSPDARIEPNDSDSHPPGKTSEEWQKLLDDSREPLIANISKRSLLLIDENLPLLSDLHVVFTKRSNHQRQAVCDLVDDIGTLSAYAYDVQEQPLANRCRLLALVFCETPSSLEQDMRNNLMDHLLALLESTKLLERPPKWLAAHLLVTEALFTLADEPRIIPTPKEGEPIVAAPIPVCSARPESRTIVFDFCLQLLANDNLPADELLSVLRLFVLLTRDRQMVAQFINRDSLLLLFKRLRKSAVNGGSSYVAIILRHIVEDVPTIQSVMQQTIRRYFAQPRSKSVDLGTYLRNCSAIALRDTNTFVDVTNAICQVENPYSLSPHIKLKTDLRISDSAASTLGDATDIQMDNVCAMTSSVPDQSVETVINVLINELINAMKMVTEMPPGPTLGDDTSVPFQQDLGEVSMSSDVSGKSPETAMGVQENQQFLCFIMQCLTELLFSYDSCKVAFLSYSSKKRSQHFQVKETTTKFRTTALHFLLSELITYGTINPVSDSKHRNRAALCSWAMNVIGALCVDTSGTQEMKEISSDLLSVRKFVLETISRAIKDVSFSAESTEARYGRFLALADLCHRLLTVRVNASTRKQHQDEIPTHVAKIMLEKNFVATLTNALSEVDLNYPNVRNLVASILRPLEYL